MNTDPVQIQMLGGLSVCRGGTWIHAGGRSRKSCLLLAYLILERERPVPYGELIGLIWDGPQEQDAVRVNALKAILHRIRNFLDRLGEGAGRELLLSRDGCFQWNPKVSVSIDAEEFSRLIRESGQEGDEDRRLELWIRAAALYRGEFLPSLASWSWASAKGGELHRAYLDTMLKILPMLTDQGRWQEAAQLSGEAFALEPCREDLCRWLMESFLQLGLRDEAAQTYEGLHQRMMSQVGTLPAAPLRELYRQSKQEKEPWAVTPIALMEQLHEPPGFGALLCEYDFFRTICHSMARAAVRTGKSPHIALISISSKSGSPLAWHSLNRAMDNLQELIRARLRRGDAFSRCSASQFIMLLPGASFENSQMVCDRITRAFARQYPHSPARLEIYIQPLPPDGGEEGI